MDRRLASLVLAFGLSSVALAPGTAHAGGCTPCASSAECVAMFGAPAFCIQWDDATGGCAGTPIQCCPGQGCSALSGRPSCEGEGRCHVIDQDAGTTTTPDMGLAVPDAGAGTDAGAGGSDAGSTAMDAGSTGMDAGTGGGTSRGGCACGVGRRASASGAWLVGLAVAAMIARRRA